MAAGEGFKEWQTGDVLTANDVNGYLNQGIWVFDDAADRTAQVTSPQEGNFAYLRDDNKLYYYTGSAWAEADTSGIQPSEFAAKGDLLAGTGASTFDNLAVGTNGHVLTADSAETTGMKWAPAAGGSSSFVGCSLRNSGNLTVSTGATSVITWNTENIDTDAFHSTSTNTGRITIPSGKNGKYLFTVGWIISNAASGSKLMRLRKNGSSILLTHQAVALNSDESQSITAVLDLVATDYIEAVVFQNTGGNLTVYMGATDASAWFDAVYLGA